MTDRERVIKYLQRMASIYDLNGDIQSMRTIDDAIFLLSNIKPIVTTNASRMKESGFLVMTNREKVIRGLEACQVEENGYTTLCKANGCPYNASSTHCMTNLHKDALALLKEREKQLKEWEKHVPFLAAHGILKGDEDNA